jgi:hypothetical protein
MTIDRKREWRLHPDGPLLGYRQHVSPYGGIAWATVNLDTNEVIALEHYDYYLRDYIGGASCHPHQLAVPDDILSKYPIGQMVAPKLEESPDGPPYALTAEHLISLERSIRAEGYSIFVNTDTNEIKLVRKGTTE